MFSELPNRDAAVLRALDYIDEQARVDFGARARDYMLGVRLVGQGFSNATIRARALGLGDAFAARWRRELESSTVAERDPDALRMQIGDAFNAQRAGALPDEEWLVRLGGAARPVGFGGFFGFDPRTEAPPAPATGSRYGSRWDVWQHALILGFVCERLGFECGGTYFDVLKWLPVLKQYEPLVHQPTQAGGGGWRVYGAQLSALTHVVYTLSDYDQARHPHDTRRPHAGATTRCAPRRSCGCRPRCCPRSLQARAGRCRASPSRATL